MLDSQAPLLDDAALVEQAKSGETEAFGVLYERYAASIYRFLCAQLPDDFEAEDLTAEVFLRAWGSLHRYRERGFPFSTFLFKVARNALIDHWRKTRLDPRRSLDELGDLPARVLGPGELLIGVQDRQDLREALAGLREDYRLVLVLRFINELSSLEVSRVMGRSEGAVRVLQHRALQALRKKTLAGQN
jgi:RNA polymerase sigma-70 factor (ECF subfamily)